MQDLIRWSKREVVFRMKQHKPKPGKWLQFEESCVEAILTSGFYGAWARGPAPVAEGPTGWSRGVLFWGGGSNPPGTSLEEEALRVVLEEGALTALHSVGWVGDRLTWRKQAVQLMQLTHGWEGWCLEEEDERNLFKDSGLGDSYLREGGYQRWYFEPTG